MRLEEYKAKSHAVKKMNIARFNINVLKEIFLHKIVITLRMIGRQTDIFIHIKGDNVSK